MQNPQLRLNRRELLESAGLVMLGRGVRGETQRAETPSPPTKPKPQLLNRFPRMVQEYFVGRVRQAEQASLRIKSALKTRTDAEAYVSKVKQEIRNCFGPLPEKTPLHPRTTGVLERDAYRIEKVIFESRPHFLVTGNLYVPKGRRFPLPGVVGVCGHSENGKAYDSYQSFAQGLARLGYVVLIFDPIGQGERVQYLDGQLRPRLGIGVPEHLYAGNQQVLVGENLAAWEAWDGIRALDYLLSREEVDRRHVGITGNSGGGTQTTWLCGLDDRWTMAAPACFVTTFRRNLENELPADTEQYPPKVLARNLDMDDFLAAMAPKPVIILAKEKDFFDVRGTEEAYDRLKRLYTLLGAPDNIALFIGPTYHGYSQENRHAMYAWFNRHTGARDVQTEPPLVLEKAEDLQCTPGGQVAELGSHSIFLFTREKSKTLASVRPRLRGEALRRAVTAALNLPPRIGVPEFRILRALPARGYPKPCFARYAVETENGIQTLVYLLSDSPLDSRPSRASQRAILYVSHQSSDAELRQEPLISELVHAEPAAAFFTCDVRGIGESQPDTCGEKAFLDPYGSDYFYAGHSIMLDRPYVGQRTHDVLRVLDWMRSNGYTEVHVVGKGWGSLPAAFASLISDQVVQVTLKHAPTSYAEIAESEDYRWPLSVFVPALLRTFDLPDCYQALEAKRLRQIEPWGPMAGLG